MFQNFVAELFIAKNNKAFIDIRLRPGIATHSHTAHYGQM